VFCQREIVIPVSNSCLLTENAKSPRVDQRENVSIGSVSFSDCRPYEERAGFSLHPLRGCGEVEAWRERADRASCAGARTTPVASSRKSTPSSTSVSTPSRYLFSPALCSSPCTDVSCAAAAAAAAAAHPPSRAPGFPHQGCLIRQQPRLEELAQATWAPGTVLLGVLRE